MGRCGLELPRGCRHVWGLERAGRGSKSGWGQYHLPPLRPLTGLAITALLHLSFSSPWIEDRAGCSFLTPPSPPPLPRAHPIVEGWEGRLHHPHDETFEYSDVGSWLEVSCLSLCCWSGDNTDSLVYLCSPRASQVPGAAAVIASSPVRCGWRETRTA